jgi:hypothetical protein
MYQEKTIGEYRKMKSVEGKHPSWVHSHIRMFCRSWNKELLKLPCACCNYNLHVELCHIKPISSFPDESLLGDVNSSKNIIQLCRNCHWEFDNGYIIISKNSEGFPEFEDLLPNRFQLDAPNFDSFE